MTRLRRFAIAALAAATVTVGSLAPVPTASAMPRSCQQLQALIDFYYATGWAYYTIGAYNKAWYYWGQSDALKGAMC